MTMEVNKPSGTLNTSKKRFGWLQVLGLMVICIILTAGVTIWVFRTYFFPSEFKPVSLSPSEEKVLAAKLENFSAIKAGDASQGKDASGRPVRSDRQGTNAPLKPEPYREDGLKREIGFTERELNGLLAKNTDLATRLAIDLSDDLISAKLLLPVDEDFPILGGKILRFRSGMAFTYNKGKPVLMLKGVSIMGVPIPNAWLGGLKNIDLVEKFGGEKGFWKSFADGVEDVKIEEGLLKIKLKE